MARPKGQFRSTTRLIYSIGMAERLYLEQAPPTLQGAIDKTGSRVMDGQLGADLTNNWYDLVVLRTAQPRPKGMPLPIAAGVLHDYGFTMDAVQQLIRERPANHDAWNWIVLQLAFQASQAWLAPDWLLMANYAELMNSRRWLAKLGDSAFAAPLRHNPCRFEEGVRTRMQPWIAKVLQPNFERNAAEIKDQLRSGGRQAVEATSAWLYIQFYEDLNAQFYAEITDGLAVAVPRYGDPRNPHVVTGWGPVPTAEDVSPLGRLPHLITPSPQRVRDSKRAGVTQPPAPADAKVETTAAPSQAPAPARAPTGDPTHPVQDAERVAATGLTPADWVDALAGTDFDWMKWSDKTLKGGFRAKEDRNQQHRVDAMVVHLKKMYGAGADAVSDAGWKALAAKLPGAMEFVQWKPGDPAPEPQAAPPAVPARRQSERTGQSAAEAAKAAMLPSAAPVKPSRRQTPTQRVSPPRRRTSSRRPTSSGYPKLPVPRNVRQGSA